MTGALLYLMLACFSPTAPALSSSAFTLQEAPAAPDVMLIASVDVEMKKNPQ